jgi:hypothetical protein
VWHEIFGDTNLSRLSTIVEPAYKDVLLSYLIRVIEALLEIRALTK